MYSFPVDIFILDRRPGTFKQVDRRNTRLKHGFHGLYLRYIDLPVAPERGSVKTA